MSTRDDNTQDYPPGYDPALGRVKILTRADIGWDDPPGYDRALGRMRTPSDDFYDHRKVVLDRIQRAIQAEKDAKKSRKKRS